MIKLAPSTKNDDQRKAIGRVKTSVHFPKVHVTRTATGFDATVGIMIKSILQGNLIGTQVNLREDPDMTDQGINPRYFQRNREAFLHVLAGWPEHVTLEIRITTAPHLICKPRGKIHLVMLLHSSSLTEEDAKEEIITRYLALMPLLISHFPEIEFVPMAEDSQLTRHIAFFQEASAFAVHRRVQQINLSEPFRKKVVGLQAASSSGKDCNVMIQHRYPWVPSLDDWARLINTLMNHLDPIQMIIRVARTALKAEQINKLENNLRQCELFLSSGEPYQLAMKKQIEMIRDVTLAHLADLTSACFKTGVFLLANHPLDISLGHVMGQAINGNAISKEHSFFQGTFAVSEVSGHDASDTHYYHEKEAFSVAEAASIFRFPSPSFEDCTGLPVRRFRTGLAMTSYNNTANEHVITLFSNEHKHIVQPITIGAVDRVRHTFIIGQTGAGKSTLMESMILQDIKGNQGLAVIDPHGDLVDGILGKIPQERMENVILFDVLDREYPLGFNILQWSTIDERDLIIDELYSVIDHLYDMRQTGGPMFESNLRGMLKLLMGERKCDDFTPTILNFMMCYLSEGFRNWLASRTDDPNNRDFIRELERTGGEASLRNIAPYVTSKFGRYTNDATLMRIIGQERTSFDFDDIMNNGKIFLVKLGKGRFGSHVSSLLANMLVSRFKYTAMKRGSLPKDKRRDFYLYVDECHNLPSENFTELLAEARKFRMSLTLATQYTAQMSLRDTRNSLLSAIMGNVGTIIAFRLGQEDARLISPVFQPYFSTLDIIGLPNWQGYARLQQGIDVIPPFSFRSYKDETIFNEALSNKIKEFSRLKYGTDKNTVDARIREQRTIWQKSAPPDEQEDRRD